MSGSLFRSEPMSKGQVIALFGNDCDGNDCDGNGNGSLAVIMISVAMAMTNVIESFSPFFPPWSTFLPFSTFPLFYFSTLFQFYLPPEAAYNCVAQLGELGKFCNNYMDVIAMMADFVMTDIMMVTVR